jgi:hypothetical protein
MDNSHKRSLRPWLFVLFSYLFISQTAICIVGMRLGSDGRADFRALYSAGFMIRTGEKHDLYNFDTEMKVQNRVVSHSATLPFIHPSGEALLFVPLSLFSYRSAYYLFAFVNFVLLILSALLLRAELACLANLWRPLPYAIFFCSLGVGFVLIQWPDSRDRAPFPLRINLGASKRKRLCGGFVAWFRNDSIRNRIAYCGSSHCLEALAIALRFPASLGRSVPGISILKRNSEHMVLPSLTRLNQQRLTSTFRSAQVTVVGDI